jgi:glycosyltransferase involved in cell wall biosynthesis
MTSIVVPAHNEANVICRGLRALTDGAEPGELEVIVICNGCTDATAELARGVGGPVKVIETSVASKAHALNLGDRAAAGFPRLYVDGDVTLSLDSVRALVRRLDQGDVLAAAPRHQMDLSRCSWAVRAFYDVDSRLPTQQVGIGGSGVYALSAAGRARFQEFPRITADDAFVRLQFQPRERARVDEARSVVTPPRELAGVVSIKTRSHYGNHELNWLYPELAQNAGKSNLPTIFRLAMLPWRWPKLAVYGYVKVRARMLAKRRIRSCEGVEWERDDTSREVAPVAATAVGNHPCARK